MTRALVVFESASGEAQQIALAIAEGLARRLPVDVVPAHDAPAQVPAEVRMLVVGGHSDGATVHAWLDRVQLDPHTNAAAFEIRTDRPRLSSTLDHAVRTEEKLLRGLGATLAAPAEHFVVVDATGPLADGEEDRARRWGQALGELVAARPANASG